VFLSDIAVSACQERAGTGSGESTLWVHALAGVAGGRRVA
jgi:hypothetical protein